MRRIRHTLLLCPITMIVLLTTTMGGCSPRQSDVAPENAADMPAGNAADMPVVIEKPVVDLGFVRGVDQVQQQYLLKTWGKGPVTIRKAITSCSCSPISPDLTNTTLLPNSVHEITLTMKLPWQPGVMSANAEFVTDPPCPRPLTLSLRALSADRPMVSPRQLKLMVSNDQVPQGKFEVSYMRKNTDPPLKLDRSKSGLQQFTIKSEQLESSKSKPLMDQGVITDTLTLEISSKDKHPIGEHAAELRLAWEGTLPEVVLPVRIVVLHPLPPMAPRVFLGEVAPGQTITKEVVLIRRRPDVKLKNVASRSDRVTATPVPDRDRLVLKVVAPEQPGRFETSLVLSYANPEVPEFVLTISGIVSSPTASR